MAEKIKFTDGKLVVSDNPIIPFIEGDGIGIDIWNASKKVIDAAVHKAYNSSKKIEWFEVFAGEKSFEKNGEWLPNDTLDMIREHLIAIKGPLTTPIGGGIRSLNVTLRKELDLFACVRPIQWYKGTPSPLSDPSKVNMTIFRENTEDIYAGIEWENGTKESQKIIELINELGMEGKIRFPDSSSIGIKPISQEGTNRLVHSAIQYALKNNRKTLTLVHKGNIMKFTEGYFKKWGYEYAETHFADQVFTWNQYDKIEESLKVNIEDQDTFFCAQEDIGLVNLNAYESQIKIIPFGKYDPFKNEIITVGMNNSPRGYYLLNEFALGGRDDPDRIVWENENKRPLFFNELTGELLHFYQMGNMYDLSCNYFPSSPETYDGNAIFIPVTTRRKNNFKK